MLYTLTIRASGMRYCFILSCAEHVLLISYDEVVRVS